MWPFKKNLEYEAIDTVVNRALHDLLQDHSMDPDVLRASIAKLPALKKWIDALPDGYTRRAYRYWFPYFKRILREELQSAIEWKHAEKIKPKVPTFQD